MTGKNISIRTVIYAFFTLIILFGGLQWETGKMDVLQAKTKQVEIYPICRVLHHPDQFSGRIGVQGKVVEDARYSGLMLLTCGASCEGMAVKFTKEKPAVGKTIEAFGVIKREDGKFIFYVDNFKII